MAEEADQSEQLIEAMTDLSGRHEGRRAVHAKGVWAEATFTASPEGTALCDTPHMSGEPATALIRFSSASGNPEAHDAQRNGGGLAVKLRTQGAGEWDLITVGPPVFVARNPEDFLELLRLRKPDPETGQPDMEGIGKYLEAHPEAQLAIQSTLGTEPPASYATLPTHSPHAFGMRNADGDVTWVRWNWDPVAGEKRLPDDDARALGPDYLRDELVERLGSGPAEFDLVLQVATDEEDLSDPTALWPEERERVVAGRLSVTAVVDDPEGDGHIEVFDPTRLPDGIEPSDDEILHARPKAYSVSAYRRLGDG